MLEEKSLYNPIILHDNSSAQILFDTESVIITAVYPDELSAYRAKRLWIETLEVHFLLTFESDYEISITASEAEEGLCFSLRCHFISACARYAFWRLTHEQAPEAQYILETAHIPHSSRNWLQFQASPELRELALQDEDSPLSLNQEGKSVSINKRWFEKFESMLDKLVKSFEGPTK